MFDFDISDELRETLNDLEDSDKALAVALKKKIKEIVSRDAATVQFYKNLRKPLQEFKRVHVGNFVLLFKIYPEKNLVYFAAFKHHDGAYR